LSWLKTVKLKLRMRTVSHTSLKYYIEFILQHSATNTETHTQKRQT